MNLRQLRYFFDASQTQNLAAVAQKHLVPASAVSAAIKRLEEELGMPLFDRTANRIQLNSSGQQLAAALSIAFSELDSTVDLLRAPKLILPKLRILVQARPKWIAELIVQYMAREPGVEFIISYDYTLTDYSGFDMVIGEQTEPPIGWQSFLLSVEILCIKAPRGSELEGKLLHFRQLKDHRFVLFSKGNGMRDRYEQLCARNGFQPNVVIECNDRQILQYYVQSGLGLTIGAYRALGDNTQDAIVPLTVVDFNETQNVCVYYRENTASAHLLEFRDFLYSKRYI